MDEKDLELLQSSTEYKTEEAMDFSWLEVVGEDSFITAGTIKKTIDNEIKLIKEYFSPRKRVAKAAHTLWVSAEKDALLPFESAKSTVTGKMNTYLREKEVKRLQAEEKISETGGFVPPAPKEHGVRTTYKGEVNNPAEFITWVVKNNLINDYLTIKTAPLNTLAKAISTTDTKIPGFEAVKNVSAL